ncbi:hypothetical protein [Methanogenium sp. MK-MG]|uniref:hypothetical protein n=1 Tax=Methanogenium sp. MK-MG TaxID=2599926 RepID=UPI0013EC925D|nr:hypothetical protein [Methanogenium sp. MK-MG]
MTDTSGSAGEDSDARDPVVFIRSYGNFSQEDYNIYEVMPEAINLSRSELSEYMSLQGGPLVGYGLYYKGYIEICWNKDTEVNESTMDRIYSVWNKNGKLAGVEDIPVVFSLCSKYEGD